MFGMLKPCAHGAEKYGINPADWRAHMCGLCLGLRDGHGQLARAATNTDAIVLSVLTEAQLSAPMTRTEAGPCPLRGMRRASVAAADSPGVLLASTASLLLGSAKIRDHVDDGDSAALTRRPMQRMSTSWAKQARTQAAQIGLNIEPLFAAIDSQTHLEKRATELLRTHSAQGRHSTDPARGAGLDVDARPGGGTGVGVGPDDGAGLPRSDMMLSLEDLTAPTQVCAAELFAHTAVLAGRSENIAALREAGRHFGRIAHLADAVEDFDEDRARGRFNPLVATGTSMPEAYDLLRRSESQLRQSIAQVQLDEQSVVRWILLDPLAALLRRLGGGLGLLPAAVHACRTHRTNLAGQAVDPHGTHANSRGTHVDSRGTRIDSGGTQVDSGGIRVDSGGTRVDLRGTHVDSCGTHVDLRGTQVDLRGTQVDSRGTQVDSRGTQVDLRGTRIDSGGTQVDSGGIRVHSGGTRVDLRGAEVDARSAYGDSRDARTKTHDSHQYPPPQFPPPQFPPPHFPPPGPPPRRPRRPGVGESLALILGVYCTGYACCADHTSPCTGEQKDAWYKNLGNCCDCADCCSNCSGCCSCGGGDGCGCCDCGCDCGC